MDNHQIILFDGVCYFCNFWVNFILKRDKSDLFRFATLQSETSKELLKRYHLDISDFDTFFLINDERAFKKSTAALMISKNLSGFTKLLYPLIFLPVFFRDFIYDLIAQNRYKIFGKKESCRVPSESEKYKFI